jgi:hypothetical protein
MMAEDVKDELKKRFPTGRQSSAITTKRGGGLRSKITLHGELLQILILIGEFD